MTKRTPLRNQIAEAWERTIENYYTPQRINSERSLQAALWAELQKTLPVKKRRMFIEPRMSVKGDDGSHTRYPDLVICNTREVIGIIELKYQPRSKPKWQKDIETFHWIAKCREQISICNSRFHGEEVDGRNYPISQEALYVWAGVHAKWESSLMEHIDPSLAEMFMELHTQTDIQEEKIL